MTIQRINFIFVMTLLLGSIGQVASDIYLPSLPSIIEYFGTTAQLTQLSVTFYMVGFAVSQLLYGPWSDGAGRRTPLLIGLTICLVGSVVCVFSQNIFMLIVGRCLQGLGGGAGVTLSRSILRDVIEGKTLAKLGSYLGIGSVAIMASAPVIGGYLEYYFNWHASFIFILILASAVFLLTFFCLQETNQHISSANLRWNGIKNNFITLLKCNEFMYSAILTGICYGGWLAWMTAGPIVLQDIVGLSPIQFGWAAFCEAMIYCVISFINAQLIHRFRLLSLIRFGAVGMVLSGLLMVVLYQLGHVNFYVIFFPVMLFGASTGFIFANIFALAFDPIPHIAGIGSSFFGFIQILGGVISSSCIAYGSHANQFSLALVLFVGGMLACTLAFTMKVKGKT